MKMEPASLILICHLFSCFWSKELFKFIYDGKPNPEGGQIFERTEYKS